MTRHLLDEVLDAKPPAGKDCEATTQFIGIDWFCGAPAAGLFRRVCVHEHIRDGWLCRDHAEAPERGLCRACFDLPGDLSHECPISITDVTAEVAS